MKITRIQIIHALCDVVDGYNEYDLDYITGLGVQRCREIIKIAEAVNNEMIIFGKGQK